MGYTTSTVHGIEVPDSSEANDVPEDIGKVVTALEGGSIIRRLTGAAIAALTGAQKTAGVMVYNTTTGKLQISNGAAWVDLDATAAAAQATAVAAQATANAALPKSGGTMTGKITLDGNPSAALHAVPRQWVDPVYGVGTVGAGQSLTAGQWNTIDGWTVSESQSMVFTSITFPVTGVWVVTAHASVQFSSNPNEKYIARLMLNGSTVVAQAADFPVASTFDAVMALSAVVNVSASNTIGLSVYNGAGATRTLRDARLAATLIAR